MIAEATNLAVRSRPARALLMDQHGRRILHLRLSVTSACDLNCVYCQPRGQRHATANLSDVQRVEFVQFLHQRYGLSQVRITGGEPLIYPGVEELIAALRAQVPGVSLAITTNGQRLGSRAMALRQAGLHRLNISIDSLDAQAYRELTGGELEPVVAALGAALSAGFPPPKLNAVILRGHNEHEVCDLAAWAMVRGCEMRFLEAMPIGPAADVNRRLFVPADEIERRLRQEFLLTPLPMEHGATAVRFIARGPRGKGTVGLIAPMTKPFCGSCGRVRLTSDGRLFPCLLDSRCAELRPAWSSGRFDSAIADELIRAIVRGKLAQGPQLQSVGMVSLGG